MDTQLMALLDPDEEAALLPFLSAVAEQVVHRLAAPPPSNGGMAEWAAAARALALVRDAASGEVEGAARRLLAEPPMLTAFFQNADLLWEHHAAQQDAVGALVMQAMERISGDL